MKRTTALFIYGLGILTGLLVGAMIITLNTQIL